MRLTPKPLEHLEDADRYQTHDTFGTSSVREQLSNLVSNLQGHGVIVVDGPWGSGKTTFTKMWAKDLEAQGHPVVLIDAFEVDHSDDGFLPMIIAITNLLKLQEQGKEDVPNTDPGTGAAASRVEVHEPAEDDAWDSDPENSILSRLLSKAEDLLPVLRSLSVGIPMVATVNVGLAVKGMIDLRSKPEWKSRKHKVGLSPESTEGHKITLSPSSDMKIKSEFDKRLDRAKKSQEAVEGFRRAMTAAVKQLTDRRDARPPLVFIIDELDRCTPRFALQVLERMKHLFSIDGICFVLVTHLPELAAMIQHEYGLRDPDRYLDKFYHISVDINRVHAARDMESVRWRYVRYLRGSLGFDLPTSRYFRYTLRNLIEIHGISLRSVERVMVNLGLYQSTEHCSVSVDFAHFAATLCVMRVSAPDLFRCAAVGSLTFRQVMEFLRIEEWRIPSDDDGTFRQVIRAWWWLVIVNDEKDESFDELERQIRDVRVLYQQAILNNAGLAGLRATQVLRQICMDLSLFTQP